MTFNRILCQPKHHERFNNCLLLCLAHLFFLAFLFAAFRYFQGKSILPAETELLNWDAEHYYAISQKGYFGINVAFFPLLPAIWRFSGLNVYGIVAFNIFIFYGAFLWLARILNLSGKQVLLALSIPGFMFFYVPYTEALFFSGTVLLLYALKRERFGLLIISILVNSFIRPVISILLPALLLTIFVKHKQGNPFYATKTAFWSIISVLPGLLCLAFIQETYTGNYWGFITIQAEHWHHYLRLPSLPLSSWENSTRLVLILDGAAFFISVLGAFKALEQLWLRYKQPEKLKDGTVVFSLFYLAGTGAAVLLFQGGIIMNMNRYLFASAFLIVIFKYWADNYKFRTSHLLILLLGLEIFWLFFNSFGRVRTLIRLSLASAYFTGVLALFHRHYFVRNTAFTIFYIANSVAQVYCLNVFLNGQWVS